MSYFVSRECAWHLFDLFLVVLSLEEVVRLVSPEITLDGGSNTGFLRILRIAKMMKLFRIVRLMRAFRELRLIWVSIIGSMRAIFWAMILLAVCMFLVGICLMQAASSHLNMRLRNEEWGGQQVSEDSLLVIRYWGSMLTAMNTLYMCVTNGADWEDIARTLRPIGWGYYALFLFFIFFYNCVVTNTLTSLFVEATMTNAEKDHAAIIETQMENFHKYVSKLEKWFRSLDVDESGKVSYEEFCNGLNDPSALAFASTLGVEITDLKQFFMVLSEGGTRDVDIETFVLGCIKMRGAAKSMDVVALQEEIRNQSLRFEELCREQFENLRHAHDRHDYRHGHAHRSRTQPGLAHGCRLQPTEDGNRAVPMPNT